MLEQMALCVCVCVCVCMCVCVCVSVCFLRVVSCVFPGLSICLSLWPLSFCIVSCFVFAGAFAFGFILRKVWKMHTVSVTLIFFHKENTPLCI